jgi:hypothetical protein
MTRETLNPKQIPNLKIQNIRFSNASQPQILRPDKIKGVIGTPE